jgi:hypothetical protein
MHLVLVPRACLPDCVFLVLVICGTLRCCAWWLGGLVLVGALGWRPAGGTAPAGAPGSSLKDMNCKDMQLGKETGLQTRL